MTVSKIFEPEIRRNNLDKSSSPYLLQHTSNPVWWQEWSDELISYARSSGKLLFVSVGYATCHWCHVMAAEAFSDIKTATYLNNHFICIKVDREHRPDIDQFLMDFINSQNGRGGWPLNVFMTPDLKPVYALTYAPAHTRNSMSSLITIAERVSEFYMQNRESIPPFESIERQPDIADESSLEKILSKYYDPDNGGFGMGQKFPPHSSLLYLLYQPDIKYSPSVMTICMKTLDSMQNRGLNDHLQGGIFRYCIDNEWIIPHFEKMLYDQAMAIWCYSLAFRVSGREQYRSMAEKILKCLDECFKLQEFYITGLDADTEHEEGATYLWSDDQLRDILLPDEYRRFSDAYHIDGTGNFEGMIHLIRRNNLVVDDIEEKLLAIRKERKQPNRDEKILCGINALLAISMIQAGRFLDRPELKVNAEELVKNLLTRFWDGKSLKHSFFRDKFQEVNFLFDGAAILTAVTMLFEDDNSWGNTLSTLAKYVESFKENGRWRESWAADFKTVYASWSDHPMPSSVSLAEMGLTRLNILTGKQVFPIKYREPFNSDFYNLNAMMNNGLFHIIETTKPVSWNLLPVNTIKVSGTGETDCFMGTCSLLGVDYISI
jgi:hypothetical protein